jgi:hypothetical protein
MASSPTNDSMAATIVDSMIKRDLRPIIPIPISENSYNKLLVKIKYFKQSALVANK